MKKVLALLIAMLFPASISAQTITYRPSTDVDYSSLYQGVGPGCGSGSWIDSTDIDLSAAYDRYGTATVADLEVDQSGVGQGEWRAKIIYGFPQTTGTHQSINLVFNSHCFVIYDQQSLTRCGLGYSTNAGVSYTWLHNTGNIGWIWTQDSVSLPVNTDLSKVWVKVCENVSGHGSSEVDLFVSDIHADVTN